MQQDAPRSGNAGNTGNASPHRVQWEVVKNQRYSNGSLSKVSCLYSIKVYDSGGMLTFKTEPLKSILLRINPSIDCVLLNKAVGIEVLDGIRLSKFASKKKNYASRLQDLSRYFINELGITLPESIKKSFVKEFEEAARLLRSSFSM